MIRGRRDRKNQEVEKARGELEIKSKQLALTSKYKSEFLANLSHEIRTPMTAIMGYTDLLFEDGDLGKAPRQRVEYITTIRRNGEHLLSIINDILDIAKIEAGKMTVESIAANPVQVIEDVVSLMQVRAHGKGVALEVAMRPASRRPSRPIRLASSRSSSIWLETRSSSLNSAA